MWKVSRDCIPIGANLQAHHVLTNGFCALCKIDYATTSNCLLFYPFVQNAWKKTFIWVS